MWSCFPKLFSRELDHKWHSQDSNHVWDVAISDGSFSLNAPMPALISRFIESCNTKRDTASLLHLIFRWCPLDSAWAIPTSLPSLPLPLSLHMVYDTVALPRLRVGLLPQSTFCVHIFSQKLNSLCRTSTQRLLSMKRKLCFLTIVLHGHHQTTVCNQRHSSLDNPCSCRTSLDTQQMDEPWITAKWDKMQPTSIWGSESELFFLLRKENLRWVTSEKQKKQFPTKL